MSTTTRPNYLTEHGHTIAAVRFTETPRYGLTVDGCTVRAGAPTSRLIRLEGETRWRRLMCWQFSNAGTCFVRLKGEPFIVHDYDLPEGDSQ